MIAIVIAGRPNLPQVAMVPCFQCKSQRKGGVFCRMKKKHTAASEHPGPEAAPGAAFGCSSPAAPSLALAGKTNQSPSCPVARTAVPAFGEGVEDFDAEPRAAAPPVEFQQHLWEELGNEGDFGMTAGGELAVDSTNGDLHDGDLDDEGIDPRDLAMFDQMIWDSTPHFSGS